MVDAIWRQMGDPQYLPATLIFPTDHFLIRTESTSAARTLALCQCQFNSRVAPAKKFSCLKIDVSKSIGYATLLNCNPASRRDECELWRGSPFKFLQISVFKSSEVPQDTVNRRTGQP
jgi:hypothetical protein